MAYGPGMEKSAKQGSKKRSGKKYSGGPKTIYTKGGLQILGRVGGKQMTRREMSKKRSKSRSKSR